MTDDVKTNATQKSRPDSPLSLSRKSLHAVTRSKRRNHAQGISDSTFSSVEVQWACHDDFGASGWQHTDSGVQTNVEGGTTVEFTVSLSAPSDLEAGVTCVALIIADEVSELIAQSACEDV